MEAAMMERTIEVACLVAAGAEDGKV